MEQIAGSDPFPFSNEDERRTVNRRVSAPAVIVRSPIINPSPAIVAITGSELQTIGRREFSNVLRPVADLQAYIAQSFFSASLVDSDEELDSDENTLVLEGSCL